MRVTPAVVSVGDFVSIEGVIAQSDRPVGFDIWLINSEHLRLIGKACRATAVDGAFNCRFQLEAGGTYGAIIPGEYVFAADNTGAIVPESAITVLDD